MAVSVAFWLVRTAFARGFGPCCRATSCTSEERSSYEKKQKKTTRSSRPSRRVLFSVARTAFHAVGGTRSDLECTRRERSKRRHNCNIVGRYASRFKCPTRGRPPAWWYGVGCAARRLLKILRPPLDRIERDVYGGRYPLLFRRRGRNRYHPTERGRWRVENPFRDAGDWFAIVFRVRTSLSVYAASRFVICAPTVRETYYSRATDGRGGYVRIRPAVDVPRSYYVFDVDVDRRRRRPRRYLLVDRA